MVLKKTMFFQQERKTVIMALGLKNRLQEHVYLQIRLSRFLVHTINLEPGKLMF